MFELIPFSVGFMVIEDPGAILKLFPRLIVGLGNTMTFTELVKVQPLEII